MLFRIRETEQIITKDELIRNSNTSFPNGQIPPSFLEERGIDPILEGPQPTGEFWQYPIFDGVEQKDGMWFTKYILGPVFETQEAFDTFKAEKDAELRRNKEVLVNSERDKRILKGKDFNGVYITGDITNRANLSDLALAAFMDSSLRANFRDGLNVDHELTALQLLQVWSQAFAYVSHLYEKAKQLKAMETIPEDFTNDSYWS